jgi:hypothetical protein
MVQLVRSVTTPATVDIAVVLASDPDVIEEQYTGLGHLLVELKNSPAVPQRCVLT